MPAPWDVTALARTPPAREVFGGEGGVRGVVFPGAPYRGRAAEVFAWLGVPPAGPAAGAVPGMVLLHAGGGRAYREWVERWIARGFAAIAPDLDARDAAGERLPGGGPPQRPAASFDLSLPVGDLWPFHAVATALAARAVLAAEPGVHRERIGVMGMSWGGCLALTAAGLEPRFGAAVSVYGTAFLQHPSGVERTEVFAAMTAADRRRWHDLFDPSHHLAALAAPTLFVTGATDGGFPLDVLAATCDALAAPPALVVRRAMKHSHEAGWSAPEPYRFAGEVFRGEPPLPRLGRPEGRSGRLVAPVLAGKPARAELLWTPDGGEWKRRRWEASPARLAAGRVEAELPPAARVAFLTVEDGETAWGSSPIWTRRAR
ncbi:MAG TPA: dienelactone hydrolase family protein [Thermoanaerobaculia bacterium]|nr:dienelactone hydrolase family protein [Thermoanaerobaculia bacterium]